MRTALICNLVVLLAFSLRAQNNLIFVENKGQFPEQAYAAAELPGGTTYLRTNGLSYLFYDAEQTHRRHHGLDKSGDATRGNSAFQENFNDELLNLHLYHADFIGSSPAATTELLGDVGTNYNYYYDESTRVSQARGYRNVKINDLYAGIDLAITSQEFDMKYDLIVNPGGCVEDIQIKYRGLKEIDLRGGQLYIKTSVNEVIEAIPEAYQMIDGKKQTIYCEYVLDGNTVRYDFPLGYDEQYPLVIDPLLIFSTYSGSPADNWGNTATFGENGKLYSGGITNHFRGGNFLGEFPATAGAFQTEWGGIWDVAIFKYDSAGGQVEYATYLGGSNSEVPLSLIMNGNEELVILGITNSEDYPVSGDAYQKVFNGGQDINTILGVNFPNGSDFFITKLSSDGSTMPGSTYFGGSGVDGLLTFENTLVRNYGDQQRGEVFLDENDNILVIGNSNSTDLFTDPTIESFQRNNHGGNMDAVLARFSPDLSTLNFGGYLGGSGEDTGFAVKVDSNGDIYVAGGTNSNDFERDGIGQDSTYNGGIDGWVARISGDSLRLNATTFLGTTEYDQIYFLDVDTNDDIYVLGQTRGAYPVTSGVFSNNGGGQFIHKLSNDLATTDFSTTFGTTGRFEPNISPTAFLVSECNNLYVAGWGNNQGNFQGFNYVNLTTTGLPTTGDAFRSSTDGQDFYLMVLDADATSLLYATYFGGSEALIHVDGGTSRFDKSGIVYHSVCASCLGGSTFDTSVGAWSQANGANVGCNNAAFKFDLASLRAIIQTNSITLDQPGLGQVCFPDDVVFQNFSIGGERYEWDMGDGSQFVKLDSAAFIHSFPGAGTYLVRMKAVDENTCIGEDETSVVVQVFDPTLEAGEDQTICFGENTRLTAFGGAQYEWVSEDSTFRSEENFPVVTPEDTTRYFVSITSSNGCSKIDTVDVEVVPKTDFEWSYRKVYNCFGRPELELQNSTLGDGQLIWDLGDGNRIEAENLTYSYEEDGQYLLRIEESRDECTFSDDVPLGIYTIKVPNVFTPSDGEPNATFEIVSPSKVDLSIFNRWGTLVYENADYDDSWRGEEVPAGVYYYEAEIEDETTCKGWVQVLK